MIASSIKDEIFQVEANQLCAPQVKTHMLNSTFDVVQILPSSSIYLKRSHVKQIMRSSQQQINIYAKELNNLRCQVYSAYIKQSKNYTNEIKNALFVELLKGVQVTNHIREMIINTYSSLKVIVNMANEKLMSELVIGFEKCFDCFEQDNTKEEETLISVLLKIESLELTNSNKLLISSSDLIQKSTS